MPEGKINQLNPRQENGSIFVESKNKSYSFTKLNLADKEVYSKLAVDMTVQFKLKQDYQTKKMVVKDIKPLNSQTTNPTQRATADNPDLTGNITQARETLPYAFIPVDTQKAVLDTPVWHDGSCGGDLLTGEILCTLTALTPLIPGNARYSAKEADSKKLEAWGFSGIDPGKQIAEPLRLPDERVVIAGSALKGMLRHSLGALLSAPMERVEEHRYTYRPNLDHANPTVRECRPAIVTGTNSKGEWKIDLLPAGQNVVQFRGKPAGAKKYVYRGGIDGKGTLAAAHSRAMLTYDQAHVEACHLSKTIRLTIPDSVYQMYEKTQQVLMTDHIDAHPNKSKFNPNDAKTEICSATQLSVNQLIYVEIEGNPPQVVSMGHHYQYRWAYTSSVRMKGGKLRDCLAVHNKEQGAKPQQLTGARLFFGYVKNEETPIDKGEYERLAGRIAPNHAISQEKPLFLGEEKKGYCVPLKILGQPRSSAYEFYLKQPAGNGMLQTYGDLPGDTGGDLAGRKYYPHQPAVQKSQQIALTDQDGINSKQATLARFVCQPGTTFKFTLRFARLREWELGALLAVLEPYHLADNGEPNDYAHKLGLGRPLGMGSVSVHVDDPVRVRTEKETGLRSMELPDRRKSIAAAKGKIDPEHLKSWLAMHRFDKNNQAVRKYPVAKTKIDGKPTQTIYAWHSKLRRDYAKKRRQQ